MHSYDPPLIVSDKSAGFENAQKCQPKPYKGILAPVHFTIPPVLNLEIMSFLEGLVVKLFLIMVADLFLEMYPDHL